MHASSASESFAPSCLVNFLVLPPERQLLTTLRGWCGVRDAWTSKHNREYRGHDGGRRILWGGGNIAVPGSGTRPVAAFLNHPSADTHQQVPTIYSLGDSHHNLERPVALSASTSAAERYLRIRPSNAHTECDAHLYTLHSLHESPAGWQPQAAMAA